MGASTARMWRGARWTGFFREGNLAALREIAMRRAAEHVDGDVRDYMRRHAIAGPWPASERVLALIGADGTESAVIRHAKRLADALHAPWHALHVERGASPLALVAPLELAAQLGAEVEVRAGPDLVSVVLDVAGRHHATHLVLGRARPRLWRRLSGRTLAQQLLSRAPDVALHVVPFAGAPARRRRREAPPWFAWAAAGLLVAAVTGGAALGGEAVPPRALGMVYLALVVLAGSLAGLGIALFTAALGFVAWDFFFLPPLYQLSIASLDDGVALLVFAMVAGLSGSLASRVRGAGAVRPGAHREPAPHHRVHPPAGQPDQRGRAGGRDRAAGGRHPGPRRGAAAGGRRPGAARRRAGAGPGRCGGLGGERGGELGRGALVRHARRAGRPGDRDAALGRLAVPAAAHGAGAAGRARPARGAGAAGGRADRADVVGPGGPGRGGAGTGAPWPTRPPGARRWTRRRGSAPRC